MKTTILRRVFIEGNATKETLNTLLAYAIGSLVVGAVLLAAVIAIVQVINGNVHLADGQI